MAERSLAERDQDVIWHPYTQMQSAAAPVPIVRGEGVYLIAEDGRKYIDAVSSWWVNIHGHAHPYIAGKVADQLNTLEHVIFAGFTHPSAVELAERLLAILPDNQKRVFYSDNGSTAVEVALKMCFQFWSNTGRSKNKVVAFHDSYHGDTFGAMAVSARSAFTKPFEEFLFDVRFIDLPTRHNISDLKQQLSKLAAEASAFIFEPLVQGAGGMNMYDAELLDELIIHCRHEQILTIADEVMTGFGRTGKLFAAGHLREKPDVMCFSKGITGGTMALGLTTCSDSIYEAFLSDDKSKTLFHGHSFTANPVTCSAALASLDLLLKPETLKDIERITTEHERFRKRISGHSKVRTVRQTGTILAIEWETGTDTSYFNSLRDKLYDFFLEKGILLRPLGNIVYIMAPYCITNDQLEYIYEKIEDALAQI